MGTTLLCDRHTLHQFHDAVGTPVLGRARIETVCDVGMIHQRKCLSFSRKPVDDLARIHAGFDCLDRHFPARISLR